MSPQSWNFTVPLPASPYTPNEAKGKHWRVLEDELAAMAPEHVCAEDDCSAIRARRQKRCAYHDALAVDIEMGVQDGAF